MAIKKGIKIIAENRKAYHDYYIDERYEAGVALSGTEVKSLRAGKVNLKDSYVQVKDGEMWLIGVHISPYENGNRFNLDPERNRKLLLWCLQNAISRTAKSSLRLVLQEVRRITTSVKSLPKSRQTGISTAR